MDSITKINGTELEIATALHQKILINISLAAQALFDFTKGLKQMRDERLYLQLGFENFEEYLEQAVGIKQRQAYNYIFALERLGESDFASMSHLGITKIEMLTAVPLTERENFIAENDVEGMTARELKDAIEKNKGYEEQISLLTEQIATAQSEQEESGQGEEIKGLKKDLALATEEKAKLEKQLDDKNTATFKAQKDLALLKSEMKSLKEKPIEVAVAEPSEETLAAIKATAEQEVTAKLQPQLDKLSQLEQDKLQAEEKTKDLERKLKIAGSKETAKFSLYFEQVQNNFNLLLQIIGKVEETDPDTAVKLKGSIKTLAANMAGLVG